MIGIINIYVGLEIVGMINGNKKIKEIWWRMEIWGIGLGIFKEKKKRMMIK